MPEGMTAERHRRRAEQLEEQAATDANFYADRSDLRRAPTRLAAAQVRAALAVSHRLAAAALDAEASR